MKPLARYAALYGYADLCADVGIDPVPLMREVGLDPASLSMQDRRLPAVAVATLLERSAAAAGRQDFGLRLAEFRRFSNLGPLSLVIREEPDVRSVLRVLAGYEHTYNEAMRIRSSEADERATLRVELDFGEPVAARQSVELAVAVLHRLLRGMLGSRWNPLAVCFAHPAPGSLATHRRVFGTTLRFDQEFTEIALQAADLDVPNRMSDPLLRPYAQQVLHSLEAPPDGSIADRVTELIELLLPTGRCSVEQVARSLGVDRRSVHRRLADTGQTYSALLNDVRVDLAQRMVANPGYSLTEIADLLSFSAPGNFSRWFKGQFGSSPSEWRNARR